MIDARTQSRKTEKGERGLKRNDARGPRSGDKEAWAVARRKTVCEGNETAREGIGTNATSEDERRHGKARFVVNLLAENESTQMKRKRRSGPW